MYTSAEGESTSQPVLFCCEIWLELVGLSGKTGKQKIPSNFIITFGVFCTLLLTLQMWLYFCILIMCSLYFLQQL